jgi:hypothetical protein
MGHWFHTETNDIILINLEAASVIRVINIIKENSMDFMLCNHCFDCIVKLDMRLVMYDGLKMTGGRHPKVLYHYFAGGIE